MRNKWKSRKFWVMIIMMVYTATAMGGFDVPIEQVVVLDAIGAVWILVEGIIDAVKK